MRPHPGQAIVAGFVATTAMILALCVLVCGLAGTPLDSATLGGRVGWMPAIVLRLINASITLPPLYVYLVFRLPPGKPWISGALWGVILWCLTEIIVMRPMQGALSIVTSIGATAGLVFGLLLVFLVYDVLFGCVAGAESPRPSRLPESRSVAA